MMARARSARAAPAPLTRSALWRRFWRNAVGIPFVVLAGLTIIGGALWLTGGEMMWRALSDMADALFWTLAIILMYPLLLVMWIAELRDGLRKARE